MLTFGLVLRNLYNDSGIIMKRLVKIITHFLFLSGVIIFIILPENKYHWMHQMDPSIQNLPTDNTASNREVVITLLLVVIVLSQLTIALKSKKKAEKIISLTLSVIAVSVWLMRMI